MDTVFILTKKLLPYFIIIFITLSFFSRLFFPQPGIFSVYDSVFSNDLISYNLAVKEILSRSLKEGVLPYWTKNIGTGFPLFAESQIGTFQVFNLILFYFFDTWLAFNLSYIVIFLTAYIGSYLFSRKLKISILASLFSATAFTMGGSLMGRLQHFNYLQAISFIPWLFLLGISVWEKKSYVFALLFAFVLFQQIVVGGMQWMLIGLIGLCISLFVKFITGDKENVSSKLTRVGISTILSILVSFPQLLSTMELQRVSARSGSLGEENIYLYSFHPKRLITFILPNYYHGLPWEVKNPFDPLSGLYWEESVYMGILPLMFLIAVLIKRKKTVWEMIFWIILVFSLFISLGNLTLFGQILRLPVLNSFRVPPRFLVLTSFSLAMLAGFGFDWFRELLVKIFGSRTLTFILSLILVVLVFDLRNVYLHYYPVIPVQEYITLPETASVIGTQDRFYTFLNNVEQIVRRALRTEKRNQIADFHYLKNGLDANISLSYDRAQLKAYSGLLTRRADMQNSLATQLLAASGVQYIISTSELDDINLSLIKTVASGVDYLPPYYIYQYKNTLSRFRLVSDYVIADNLDQAAEKVKEGNFPFDKSVLLENNISEQFDPLSVKDITIMKDQDVMIELRTKTDKNAILVVADSYYPAWKASINGYEVNILPANINQKALVVPPGENAINFWYSKDTLYKGLIIAVASLLAFHLIWIIGSLIKTPKSTQAAEK